MDGEGVVRGRTEGLVEPNFSWSYPSGVRAAAARRSSPNHGARRLVGAHGLRGEGGEVMWSGKTLGRNPTTQWPAGDGLRLSVFRERVGGI